MESDLTWIKIYRSLLEWEWYNNSKMVHLFIHLLLKANHRPGKWQGMEIKRGQLVTGRKKISTETGISEQSVRTCLKRLESTNEITIKSTNKFSIITICNYEHYQQRNIGNNQPTNQQLTNNQPTTNQQLTTNKNIKNIKNEKNKRSPSNSVEFSAEVINLAKKFRNTLPERLWPTNGQKERWLDVIDKCIRLDGYKPEQIEEIIDRFRNDPFWKTNFMTPLKLRKKNSEGIKYIDYFWEK